MENWKNELKTALLAYEDAKKCGAGAAQAKVQLTNILFNARHHIRDLCFPPAGKDQSVQGEPVKQSTRRGKKAAVEEAPAEEAPDGPCEG